MNVQPIKINFNNKIYEVTFKSIDSEKPFVEKIFDETKTKKQEVLLKR